MDTAEKAKTVIAEDVEILGSIRCGSNINIDGKVNGDITCTGDAVIGSTSTVKGNITLNSIVVQGQVTGNIIARDKIELKSTARVHGDIRAKRLIVEDGVTMTGKSEVNPSGKALPESIPPVQASELTVDKSQDAEGKRAGFFGRK